VSESPTHVILIPFQGEYLALTVEQFREAQERAHALMPAVTAPAHTPQADQVLDAAGMEKATGIPATWFLEQARRGTVPHLRAGKYVRFRLIEVLDALKADTRHTDRLSVHVPKPARNQRLAKGCYRAATKN